MTINSSTTVNGIVTEDIFVNNSASAVFNGITNSNIFFSDTSSGLLQGIHNGDLFIDHNCSLKISGILNGTIKSTKSVESNVLICKDAVINGKHYLSDEFM